MTTILIMTTMLMSILFLFMNHPLSFGLILLIQTLLVSLMTGMMNYNFWFSYILFLIMVGGMLILFIYMTSIASNEKFLFTYSLLMTALAIVMIGVILTFMDSMITSLYSMNYELTKMPMDNSFSMSKYTDSPTNNIMFLVITYLLITLIMVVKITNLKHGPLRQKF